MAGLLKAALVAVIAVPRMEHLGQNKENFEYCYRFIRVSTTVHLSASRLTNEADTPHSDVLHFRTGTCHTITCNQNDTLLPKISR